MNRSQKKFFSHCYDLPFPTKTGTFFIFFQGNSGFVNSSQQQVQHPTEVSNAGAALSGLDPQSALAAVANTQPSKGSFINVTVATIVEDVVNYVTVVLEWIRLCVTLEVRYQLH